MARQARCFICRIHYQWGKQYKLKGARCPKCGNFIWPTTWQCKDPTSSEPPIYAKFKIGSSVKVKPGSPGYELWYKNKIGTITNIVLNDAGELRYEVDFGEGTLPFGEWEMEKIEGRKEVEEP